MQFQWYPGHMTKARRQMEEDIKLIDLVIELVDARIPLSSRNPDIDKLAGNKARLILMNKADLADSKATALWKAYFQKLGYFVAEADSRNKGNMKAISQVITEACREKTERDKRRGIKNRPVRAMIVGIPNVGKSTFINTYAGRACAKTGNKPGVTKGKQWIRLNKQVELLDTPGILWPKFEDQQVGLMIAFIGSMKDEILNTSQLAAELIRMLEENYPGALNEKYRIEDVAQSRGESGENMNIDMGANENTESAKSEDPYRMLERIARSRHCLLRGNELDTEKAAILFLDDFRSGRIGRLTLEYPQEV